MPFLSDKVTALRSALWDAAGELGESRSKRDRMLAATLEGIGYAIADCVESHTATADGVSWGYGFYMSIGIQIRRAV